MSTNVLVGFDPYVAWLNVRTEQRPLGPYQLLNLQPLEANLAKINAAIIKQRQALETFRSGANPKLWAQVRDEVEDAIATLTQGDRKVLLDASIQRKAALRVRSSSGQKAAAGPTITCRNCDKTNTSERKFCGGCGAGLWDLCGSCDAEVPVDERFCGICGSNLLDVVAAEIEQAKAKLAEARQLRRELKFEAALFIIRKLAKSPDPRLDETIEIGLELMREIEAEIAKHRARASDALERAQMLISGYAYEGAIDELTEIPEQFRTEQIQATLAEAHAKRNEILALSGEIREAIEQKRTSELLPRIERLLTLKPNHPQAQKLAVDLRDRLVASGKKRLSEHRYAEALEQFRAVPRFVRTPEIDKLAEQAEELAWILNDLRLSPLADQTLLELAERLVKLAPGNQQAAKLKEQISKRLTEASADPRHAAPVWDASPKKTFVGWPVDWLTGSKHLRATDAASNDALKAQPGSFFVALGLALQGIGKCAIDVNLAPEEKTNVFRQFKSLISKKVVRPAWGIDLNAYGLRAVKLIADEKENTVAIAAAEFIKHRKVLSQPEAELERGLIVAETLKTFLEKHSLADARVIVNMPGQKLLGRFFDLPPLELKKVHDAVQFEARHQIPFSLESLSWDYDLITSSGAHAEAADNRRVTLVAGREFHVQERLATFKEASMHVDVLQSDCLALHNFIAYEFFNAEKKEGAAPNSQDAIMTVDVGCECTNIVVTSPTVQWFRTINFGGDRFTEPLVKQFKLTFAQAELLKREPQRARKLTQLYATFDPLIDELASEITRSIESFLKLYPDQTLSRIYGVGGGFMLHGLLRKLRIGK